MADIDIDQLGPVDYLVVGFPAEKANFSGSMADELKKLTDSGTIRVLDLVMVTKDEDGTVAAAELRDHDETEVGELRALERTSLSCWPWRMSSGSAPIWNRGARLRCSCGRTRGRVRWHRRFAMLAGN